MNISSLFKKFTQRFSKKDRYEQLFDMVLQENYVEAKPEQVNQVVAAIRDDIDIELFTELVKKTLQEKDAFHQLNAAIIFCCCDYHPRQLNVLLKHPAKPPVKKIEANSYVNAYHNSYESAGYEHEYDRNEALRLSVTQGYSNIIEMLIEHGADYTFDEHYCLKMSIIQNNKQTVEYLLNKGIDFEQVQCEPFFSCVKLEKHEILQSLLHKLDFSKASHLKILNYTFLKTVELNNHEAYLTVINAMQTKYANYGNYGNYSKYDQDSVEKQPVSHEENTKLADRVYNYGFLLNVLITEQITNKNSEMRAAHYHNFTEKLLEAFPLSKSEIQSMLNIYVPSVTDLVVNYFTTKSDIVHDILKYYPLDISQQDYYFVRAICSLPLREITLPDGSTYIDDCFAATAQHLTADDAARLLQIHEQESIFNKNFPSQLIFLERMHLHQTIDQKNQDKQNEQVEAVEKAGATKRTKKI